METASIAQTKKEAQTDYPILQLLKDRWSPRTFSDIEPTEQELRQLFEAASWAASSFNRQPWRYIVARKGTETYQKIFDCLSDFNQSWATSPVLMLTAYKKTTDEGDNNFHAMHDLGLSVATLSIQAQSMGIALHQMAGVDWKAAHKAFDVPEDYHVTTAIALGFYGGNAETLSEDLQKQEQQARSRKDQKDFVFTGTWGEAF
ncbi:MAG: nitroreductase family protein [Bacteroidota bacterium]